MKPLEDYLARRLADRTFALAVLVLFFALALTLAAVGIFGVISYSMTRRTREVGIRMALGAGRRDVLKLVLVQALPLVGFGLAVGLVLSMALTRLLVRLLFGVQPTDAATLATVALLLTSVALAAAAIPARRAAVIDPVMALRHDE